LIIYPFRDATEYYGDGIACRTTSREDPSTIEVWETLDLYMKENQRKLLMKSRMKIKAIAMEELPIPKAKVQTVFQYFNKNPRR